MKFFNTPTGRTCALALIALSLFFCLPSMKAQAQNTAGGTEITNQASGSYDDGAGSSFTGQSNAITLTVANVSGVSITPDGGTVSSVVTGEQNVSFPFTLNNTSNYSAKIKFRALGASIQVTNGTATSAFVDYNGNGSYDAGTDLNILTNNSAVSTSALEKDESVQVVVKVTVASSLSAGSTVTVQLGDAGGSSPYDNQAADDSAHEVSTDSTGVDPEPVNNESEARGTITATVEADASLTVSLSAPAGPLNYSADITYTAQLSNAGSRDAKAYNLDGQSGVWVIVNVPANTALKAGQTFPAGTLFSQTALTTSAAAASYSSTEPSASSVKRVAFKVGSGLTAGQSSAQYTLVVTIAAGPFDATNGIGGSVLALANNHVDSIISDTDAATTSVTLLRSVLLGTNGHADAMKTSNNNDYTNKSVTTGINVPWGSETTAEGTATFVNTLQNTGNATDSIDVYCPVKPEGFTVEASLNGTDYVDISDGTAKVTVTNLAYQQTAQVWIKVTAPAGNTVLTEFPSTIRARSVGDTDETNDTINALYTGYVKFEKSHSVSNPTGRGGATDLVPGAVVTYEVTYTNVSSSGGTNCAPLVAHNLVITEDGNVAPNNWGSLTDPSGSPSDSGSGVVATVSSTKYTDTITALAPGASAVFSYSRVVK